MSPPMLTVPKPAPHYGLERVLPAKAKQKNVNVAKRKVWLGLCSRCPRRTRVRACAACGRRLVPRRGFCQTARAPGTLPVKSLLSPLA